MIGRKKNGFVEYDILVTSDWHVGDDDSLIGDGWTTHTEDPEKCRFIAPNKVQDVLNDKFREMAEGRYHAAFFLGDMVEGSSIKSRGFELWQSSIDEQVKCAVSLASLLKIKKAYVVDGSPYHVSENPSYDLMFADGLDRHVPTKFGTDLDVHLPACDLTFHLNHAIGVSSSQVSKATAPMAEIASAAQHDQWFGKKDLILRGHRHEILNLKTKDGQCICCPCFKGRDTYQKRKGLRFGPPVCGWIVLHVQGNKVTVDDDNWFILQKEHLTKRVMLE